MPSSASDQPELAGFQFSGFAAYAGQPGALEGVGFWPRVAARIIDLIIHITISAGAGFFFGVMILIASGGHPDPYLSFKLQHSTMASFVLAILGSIFYHTVCEGMHGSTPGKLIFSMVVVQEDGSPCRIWPAFIRSVTYLIDALFFGLIGYFAMQKSVQEQRHGDDWAHTVVCKRAAISGENLRGGGRFIAALLLAMMADAACGILGLLLKLVS